MNIYIVQSGNCRRIVSEVLWFMSVRFFFSQNSNRHNNGEYHDNIKNFDNHTNYDNNNKYNLVNIEIDVYYAQFDSKNEISGKGSWINS